MPSPSYYVVQALVNHGYWTGSSFRGPVFARFYGTHDTAAQAAAQCGTAAVVVPVYGPRP